MGQQTRKVNKNQAREHRINAISKKKAAHDTQKRQHIKRRVKIMRRATRKRTAPLETIIAYDLETTNIKAGTPNPLYITAFCDKLNYILSHELDGLDSLLQIIEEQFLIPRFSKCKFVAWNANNYDVYFIALALIRTDKYVLRPYLTASKSLRGLRVIPREDLELPPKSQRAWEFLDGISMLGLIGTPLKDFLKRFAPEYEKRDRESFDVKEFDPKDREDIAYAFRDSEGLYFGMVEAQNIVHSRFNIGLRATIGNLGIKIFQSRIPETANIREPNIGLLKIYRDFVCRGGYCHLMKRFRGDVWKYDLNQAYAAAMREAALPSGIPYHVIGEPKYARTYIARIEAMHPTNKIPFYCRQERGDDIKSEFPTRRIESTWLTKIEIDQLKREGWNIKFHESWGYPETFDMTEFVDQLEHLRMNAPGGPSGAVGTMIKAIGNNSYGKTLEQLEPLEFVLAKDCPAGYVDYVGDNSQTIPYVWCRFIETPSKDYHQPQIGAFITAHVRMVVRRAALLAPNNFLYADTDCVIFSTDVTKQLDIDPRRYGAWKLEASGEPYMLIAKKVYASEDFKTRHSKGMNVKRLEYADFVAWYNGVIPEQSQAQRQNFVKVIQGSPMFVNRTRKGTAL